MKRIASFLAVALLGMTLATGCIEQIDPQNSTVTVNQAGNAPGSFDNFVGALTSTLAGQFFYSGSDERPWDYGYSSFYLQRDVMGQDIVLAESGGNNWYTTWYCCDTGLGPRYAVCQLPWTYYYKWIDNCNTVIRMGGSEPSDMQRSGVGMAYAMRAMFYMDMARMFAQKTYGLDKSAETVPIVTERTIDVAHNPRATNEDMWAFIIDDLDKAEALLDGYVRTDVYTPDLSVVYGLKARAFLTMEEWANAEKYAKLAQEGYVPMTEAQYTSRETGFNTPNGSWMMGLTFRADDPNILNNDADSSWGSWMCIEINPDVSGCGYASNYGQPMSIDRHLYETIPATDFRRKCFVDFSLDDMPKAQAVEALAEYSDYPEWVYETGYGRAEGFLGGLSLKFRVAGGAAGHDNQYIGFVVAVPMMRVEEMYLIEAEAAGMQDAGRGQQLLTAFALTRDPGFVYGQHNEAYGNGSTAPIQNECWWQRRVEFWGEGLATFDIKRLNKGIIRSYAGTNHLEGFRWNTGTPPEWMNLCIVETETKYNVSCTNNPTPIQPSSESPEYIW